MTKGEGRKDRHLSRGEHALWRGITRSVVPLRRRAREPEHDVPEPKETKALRPAPARTSVAVPLPEKKKSPPPLAPLERKLKQRLSRGRQTIDGRLDLHGHTQAEAHDALSRFLRSAQAKGASVVLVITGKGGRTVSGREHGVLKRQVPMWLNLPEFRDYVVGFDDAAIGHGGEGALYVRLRKRRAP